MDYTPNSIYPPARRNVINSAKRANSRLAVAASQAAITIARAVNSRHSSTSAVTNPYSPYSCGLRTELAEIQRGVAAQTHSDDHPFTSSRMRCNL